MKSVQFTIQKQLIYSKKEEFCRKEKEIDKKCYFFCEISDNTLKV